MKNYKVCGEQLATRRTAVQTCRCEIFRSIPSQKIYMENNKHKIYMAILTIMTGE